MNLKYQGASRQSSALKDLIERHQAAFRDLPQGCPDSNEVAARMQLINYTALDLAEDIERRLYLVALMISAGDLWNQDEIAALRQSSLA